MPNKKLLIGGSVAILLALIAYLAAWLEAGPTAPVSREEFAQDMESFDFENLQGREREEAISHLRSLSENMAPRQGRGGSSGSPPRRPRGSDRSSGMRKAMESLQ